MQGLLHYFGLDSLIIILYFQRNDKSLFLFHDTNVAEQDVLHNSVTHFMNSTRYALIESAADNDYLDRYVSCEFICNELMMRTKEHHLARAVNQ